MRESVLIEGVGTIVCDVPDLVFDVIIHSLLSYDKGEAEFSVTELIAPPQTKVLARNHWQEITLNASRFIYRARGTMLHAGLEAVARMDPEAIVEVRFYAIILGHKVGGKIDHAKAGVLTDHKELSVYEGKRHATPKTAKPEKVAQGNCNAYLMGQNGHEIHTLMVDAYVRDWRPAESKREKGYPEQSVSYELPMWDEAKTLTFLEERVKLHQAARDGTDLPCLASERWIRNGVPMKCTTYCDVASVCPQHQAHLNPQA